MSDIGARVVVDVGPVRAQPAGVGLYVARLVRELIVATDLDLGLIGVRPDSGAIPVLGPQVPSLPFSSATYHTWLQLSAESDARRLGARLIHFTNAAAPIFGRIPYVLTVHDLSVAREPMTHPIRRWPIVPLNLLALTRASAVIVPSRWTARELGRIGVDEARINVIGHAPAFHASSNNDGSAVVAGLGLRGAGYVLYFGTLEPRKNIVRLVGAFERIANERPGLRLVLAGSRGWHFRGLEERISASPVRDRIVMPGYVADDVLAALIECSAAVAYVSIYEGFGMPVLDSMALGAAVVTSRTSSMPEAAGGAAVLVDPRNEADIARGLAAALADHDGLVERGRQRASSRTWFDVAAEHADVYRHVLRRL